MATFRLGLAGQKRFLNSTYSKSCPRFLIGRGQTTLNEYVKAILYRDLSKHSDNKNLDSPYFTDNLNALFEKCTDVFNFTSVH